MASAGTLAFASTGATDDDEEFAVDDRVSPVVYTNVYESPDPNAAVVGAVGEQVAGYVRAGPEYTGGVAYYRVAYNDGTDGWTSATNLEIAQEDSSDSSFAVDDPVLPVVPTSIYALPDSDSTELDVVDTDDLGHVVDGPSENGGQTFYNVQYAQQRGWTSVTNFEPFDREAIPSMPYYYQYDNAIEPHATCGNTSVAMLFNYFGGSVSPDQVSQRFGPRQSARPAGAAEAFNTLADEWGVDTRLTPAEVTLDELRELFDSGIPALVWGMFTPSGHILVGLGYSNGEYIVHDSAGQWNGQLNGTHLRTNPDGQYIRYDEQQFESAIVLEGGIVEVVVPE